MISPSYSTRYLTSRSLQRAAKITPLVMKAEIASAMAMKQRAIVLSSGTYSTAYLQHAARQRIPHRGLYSLAAPAPPDSPFIINAQSGGLRAHWQTRVVVVRDGTSLTLFNTDPKAKFMLGTVKMMFRPILQAVGAYERGPRLNRLAAAKSAALK